MRKKKQQCIPNWIELAPNSVIEKPKETTTKQKAPTDIEQNLDKAKS